jgi:erythromycin esterase
MDDLAERLQRSSVELETTDPAVSHNRLASVGEALADARIIGLGEATHGTREFFRLKRRIIEHFVEEGDLRLITIEVNLPEAMALNEYVLHGEGDAREALAGTHLWVWRTETVLGFVEWLREFNAGRPLDDRVRVHGIDAQYTTGAVAYLDAFLADADPELRAELRTALDAADDRGEINDQYVSDHDPESVGRVLDRLGAAFDEREAAFATATSERGTVVAQRCLRVIEQVRQRRVARETEGERASMIVRDEAMAENLAWALEHEDADHAVVWAHDSHVCRTVNVGARVEPAPSLGSYLAERYGSDYCAIGFDVLEGSFRAIGTGPTPESELATWSLDEPPADAITRGFAATDSDLAFLDLDTVREDERLDEWLSEPRAKRSLGAVYYGPDGPTENQKDGRAAHNVTRRLPEAFDGLLFVRETTPSRVLEKPGC